MIVIRFIISSLPYNVKSPPTAEGLIREYNIVAPVRLGYHLAAGLFNLIYVNHESAINLCYVVMGEWPMNDTWSWYHSASTATRLSSATTINNKMIEKIISSKDRRVTLRSRIRHCTLYDSD